MRREGDMGNDHRALREERAESELLLSPREAVKMMAAEVWDDCDTRELPHCYRLCTRTLQNPQGVPRVTLSQPPLEFCSYCRMLLTVLSALMERDPVRKGEGGKWRQKSITFHCSWWWRSVKVKLRHGKTPVYRNASAAGYDDTSQRREVIFTGRV